MKTQQEIERLRQVEQALNSTREMIIEQFGEAIPDPDMIPLIFGMMLAAIDATFAIRDGQPWRGLTDPQEIARRLLREGQLGE